jgi:hypothetical protein
MVQSCKLTNRIQLWMHIHVPSLMKVHAIVLLRVH